MAAQRRCPPAPVHRNSADGRLYHGAALGSFATTGVQWRPDDQGGRIDAVAVFALAVLTLVLGMFFGRPGKVRRDRGDQPRDSKGRFDSYEE